MFAALQQSDSSSSETSNFEEPSIEIPDFEDLSSVRNDEAIVLDSLYGSDFRIVDAMTWSLVIRPLTDNSCQTSATLTIHLSPKYPYKAPRVEVSGADLSPLEISSMTQRLQEQATACAASASVMVMELAQTAQDDLSQLETNRLSAWEQMMLRQQQEEATQVHAEEEVQLLMDASSSQQQHHHHVTPTPMRTTSAADFQLVRELERQRLALREEVVGSNDHQQQQTRSDDVDGEEDDDLWDEDDAMVQPRSASRYESDFVELGVLGRGGGGEVVKVKNRLDRRVYAVKKILLYPSKASHNRKLRREVTTISRMTHKHIVRYFQAWVEGGTMEDEAIVEEEPEADNSPGEVTGTSSGEENTWWNSGDADADDEDSSSSYDYSSERKRAGKNAVAISNLLEQEQDLFMPSPLLAGMGLGGDIYNGLTTKKKSQSDIVSEDESESESGWDSSVKIGKKDVEQPVLCESQL